MYQYLCGRIESPFGKWPEVIYLGHMEAQFLVLWETSSLTSTVPAPVSIPTESEWGFPSPYLCQHLFFSFKKLFLYTWVFVCLTECVLHAFPCPQSPDECSSSSKLFADSCDPLCGCWEPNPEPLQKQQVLLSTEPHLFTFLQIINLTRMGWTLAVREISRVL